MEPLISGQNRIVSIICGAIGPWSDGMKRDLLAGESVERAASIRLFTEVVLTQRRLFTYFEASVDAALIGAVSDSRTAAPKLEHRYRLLVQ
jgi:hypothetical protein